MSRRHAPRFETAAPAHLHTLKTSHSPKRAAVAVILRCCPWQSDSSQVLYILRATNPERDSWSGQVAFPGGRSNPSETDLEAVVRECVLDHTEPNHGALCHAHHRHRRWHNRTRRRTREEVGLDLSDTSAFKLAGRLPERPVTAKGLLVPGLVLCPFVFVQQLPTTPLLQLQGDEVAAVHWAHESSLSPEHVQYSVERAYSPLPAAVSAAVPNPLLRGAGHVSAGRKGFVLDHEAGKNCLPFPQRA